jgi:hypothetical protein
MLVATTGTLAARVANVEFLYEPSFHKTHPTRKWPDKAPAPLPTFSSNDRARWATVKALVEEGTFVIGRRVQNPDAPKGYTDDGITFTPGYGSVDKVLHPDRQEFYATKPPLLTVAAAGEYWLLRKFLKWEIDEQRWEVVVTILLTLNVLPLAIALWLLALLLERYGVTDWGRLFVFAVACFGTFLTTFSVTLSNHVPAACCVLFAAYALLSRDDGGHTEARLGEFYPHLGDRPVLGEGVRMSPLRPLLAGFFAGLAVCLDLPAAAFAAGLGLLLLFRFSRGVLFFVPAFLVPVAAQAALNYQAVGTWEPVYAKFGGPWYEYEGSHWAKPKRWAEGAEPKPEHPGIDFADEPKPVYAFHLLVGHHGLFSLTPVWVLAVAGMLLPPRRDRLGNLFHWLTPLVTAVVIGFYIWQTNNYGGYTSGPRWLFWLTPLFLLALLPAADKLAGSRIGRGLAYLCLGASAFSATYPWANPWRHPWIYQLCEYMGWVSY